MRDLALLYSIFIVSVSGGLKLWFASTFLGTYVPFFHISAAMLLGLSAYAFDRGVKNAEDEERDEIFKKVLIVAAVASLCAALVVCPNPALLLPFGIAFLYTKGIKGHRLKGGGGMKNLVVAFSWSLLIVVLLGIFTLPAVLLYLFFFCKSFVNTVIYDVRDVESDVKAGIRTIPAILPVRSLIVILAVVSLVIHGLVISAQKGGLLIWDDVILLSSVHTICYICWYCTKGIALRNTLVDGEWILYGGYSIFRDFFL